MVDLTKVLSNLKAELLAVTIIICGDLYFAVKMFALRKNFQFPEFWLVFSFVQLIVLIVCQQMLRIYIFRIGAGESYKMIRISDEQATRLHAQIKEILDKLPVKKEE